jgi:hypothetical protein
VSSSAASIDVVGLTGSTGWSSVAATVSVCTVVAASSELAPDRSAALNIAAADMHTITTASVPTPTDRAERAGFFACATRLADLLTGADSFTSAALFDRGEILPRRGFFTRIVEVLLGETLGIPI